MRHAAAARLGIMRELPCVGESTCTVPQGCGGLDGVGGPQRCHVLGAHAAREELRSEVSRHRRTSRLMLDP